MTASEYDEYDATVRVPKGAKLPRSKKTDGAYRGNFRDPDNKTGNAEFFLKDEPDLRTESAPIYGDGDDYASDYQEREHADRERADREELIRDLIFLIVTVIKLAEASAPRVKRWWNDQALPFIESTRKRIARARISDSQANPTAPTESTILVGSVPAQVPQEAISPLEESRESMSKTEALDRFVAALIARRFSEGQMEILRNVRIEDENGSLELSEMETRTPRQIGDSIKLRLEANPSLLGEETFVELGSALAKIRADGGKYSIEKRKEAPRLTDGSS